MNKTFKIGNCPAVITIVDFLICHCKDDLRKYFSFTYSKALGLERTSYFMSDSHRMGVKSRAILNSNTDPELR